MIIVQTVSCSEINSTQVDNDEQDKGWQLVGNDEFDSTTIDLQKWNYETGPNWHNNESQYYSGPNENTFIVNEWLVFQ